MTARHPLTPFGIEDRPALWDTEGPDGTCSCGEDAHPGIDCDEIPHAARLRDELVSVRAERDALRRQSESLQAAVVDLHERLAWEQRRADQSESRLREYQIEHQARWSA